MTEFLILKKTGVNSPKGVNCAVKIKITNSQIEICGEIYCGARFTSEYKVYLTNGIKSQILADGVLTFEKVAELEFSSGYIVLLDGNDNAVLYSPYGKVEFSLERAIEIINLKREEYNDYEIASENYYEGELYEAERVYNQVDNGNSRDKKEELKKEENGGAILYENVANKSQERNFYVGVKEKLEEVINSHKKDEELCKIIPNGEFCKILYDSDRYYSVGRIFEGYAVKYVCYAVKGNYGEFQPELNKFLRFIPLSPFAPQSSGYYIIFQDAITGKIVENATR